MAKMTQSEYARYRGISRQHVSRLVKLGAIQLDKAGKIDSKAADRSLDVGGGTKESFYDARARKEAALASLRELELQVKKGEYFEAESVIKLWECHIMDCRARLLALPVRLAPVVFTLRSIPEVKEVIQSGIYEALNELKQIDAADYAKDVKTDIDKEPMKKETKKKGGKK